LHAFLDWIIKERARLEKDEINIKGMHNKVRVFSYNYSNNGPSAYPQHYSVQRRVRMQFLFTCRYQLKHTNVYVFQDERPLFYRRTHFQGQKFNSYLFGTT
jgi:hypothetical protein